MKMKMIFLTVVLTFSYSVQAEAAVGTTEQDEFKGDIVNVSFDTQEFTEDIETVQNDIPFMDLLAGEIPHVYPPPEILNDLPKTYMVLEGDNLFRIAMNHNISLEELMSLNDLTGDLIHPGDVLVIADGKPVEDVGIVQVASITPETVPESKELEEIEEPKQPKKPAFQASISTPPVSEGDEFVVTATAYTAYCNGCSGTTAYGIDLRSNPDQKVIAVDPKLIPLGTRVWVEGYGEAIAGDVGGAIKGHRIDVFIPSYDSAMEWGVKKVKIKVLN
ncbi:3D domain-containing protein [Sporosarcina highlanderae]|uniref:3D domain-containing protein n=1 Tax=Sporosarcina highlanderae TaxID=3035916 RepID=A0ABT8JW01_9BACL|nr:3D domain-containing protein [Sporosarcina highlanderae]MDN4608354.1 3D domain-containing protein [Sporosarcina highlanderae]